MRNVNVKGVKLLQLKKLNYKSYERRSLFNPLTILTSHWVKQMQNKVKIRLLLLSQGQLFKRVLKGDPYLRGSSY